MAQILTVGGMFSGVGAFEESFKQQGFEVKWLCEIDKKCQHVLRRHFPQSKIYSDVKLLKEHIRAIEPVDVVVFGSPCQDFSMSNVKGGGLNGSKSSLFYEAIDVIRGIKPSFAIWENVEGAFRDKGIHFKQILSEFSSTGAVDVAWSVLSPTYFNVPHNRQRIYLVADFRAERAGSIIQRVVERVGKSVLPSAEKEEARDGEADRSTPWYISYNFAHTSKVCPCLTCDTRTFIKTDTMIRKLTSIERERLMNWKDDYTAWGVDEQGQRVDMSITTRANMTGNGVSISCASAVAEEIARVMKG